jgi:hypothetical protein
MPADPPNREKDEGATSERPAPESTARINAPPASDEEIDLFFAKYLNQVRRLLNHQPANEELVLALERALALDGVNRENFRQFIAKAAERRGRKAVCKEVPNLYHACAALARVFG